MNEDELKKNGKKIIESHNCKDCVHIFKLYSEILGDENTVHRQ
jgi:hypothetical protein